MKTPKFGQRQIADRKPSTRASCDLYSRARLVNTGTNHGNTKCTMRERITFVHGAEDAFDPKQLQIQHDFFHIKSLKAAREDRVTASLYELPQELWRALKQCHELHVRWVSERPFPSIVPFVSTTSPGLHISFTPIKDRSADLLCPLLLKVFGGRPKCTIPEDTFTGLPVLSERFASSAAYQYYELLPSLKELVTYIQQKVCADNVLCKGRADALNQAEYVDIDYDTISQSLVISAFWHSNATTGSWDEQIDNQGGSVKIEVGVLANEKATRPEELSLGGFLAVLGEDIKLNPTLFSFPSRHHLSPPTSGTNYSTAFIQPIGLHPTLRLTLPPSTTPPAPDCALHSYLTLPSSLFPDRYQLSSQNLLASNNLHSIRSLSGETDLEAPNWAVSAWGSALLLELAPPKTRSAQWHADIPLHLRYLLPTNGGSTNTSIPWPIIFWACSSDEGTKMNTNPFDRVNLGYDGLFGPRTMYYHLQPTNAGQQLVEDLKVPVLDMNEAKVKWVEAGTVVVVLLGFLWVCWTLGRVVAKDFGWEKGTGRRKKD
ncbi:hypothetical protein N7G274_010277 [Stereocaulon virgatum]|uniref:Protein PBN1 n=1 Tax=Stereocaulon virgatum TaxID=373712 RepID=A0ABR3ZY37_9LECA